MWWEEYDQVFKWRNNWFRNWHETNCEESLAAFGISHFRPQIYAKEVGDTRYW